MTAATPPTDGPARDTIRVGTFNVLGLTGFRGADAAAELGAAGTESWLAYWAARLADLDCDLLGFQEGVDHGLALQLARRAGLHVVTIPSPLRWGGHVFSRRPPLESRVFSHGAPDTTDTDPFSRCLGAALVELDPGRPWWFVDLHTCPSRPEIPEDEARRRRAREAERIGPVLDALEATGHPTIVVGDFNSDVDEDIHARLRERGHAHAMAAVGSGLETTFGKHGERPEHVYVLDHIYVHADLASRLRSARVVRDPAFWYPGPEQPGRWVASDHLPVVAELARI